ncbi:MAG TPA: DUF2846 domain-containing protein [Candidatus Acidoferrales bacterium]|nr:DUF2846 domain-containing protein [Candidatus Acidoferrales bacterium]
MRAILISAMIGLCPVFVAAQSNAVPSAAQTKMECRQLVSGQNNFISSDETLINGMACHVVKPAPAPKPVTRAAVPASAPVEATVCFYRTSSLIGAAIHPSLFIDDANVGSLGRGQKFTYTVSPGKHRIHSTAKGSGIDLDAKAGETYYVRLNLKMGFLKGSGTVTLVNSHQGEYELAKASEKDTQ